jgi:hypothetical protein
VMACSLAEEQTACILSAERGNKFLQNVGTCLPNYAVLHSRGQVPTHKHATRYTKNTDVKRQVGHLPCVFLYICTQL